MLRLYNSSGRDITDELNTEFCANPACLGEPWCSAWGLCRTETLPNITGMATEPQLQDYEFYDDQLFTDLSQQLDSAPSFPEHPSPSHSSASVSQSSSSSSTTSRQFAQVKTDQEVELARATGVPSKTKQDTKYCINLWSAWTSYREKQIGDVIGLIETLSTEQMQYWLSRFILEVRKITASYYE